MSNNTKGKKLANSKESMDTSHIAHISRMANCQLHIATPKGVA